MEGNITAIGLSNIISHIISYDKSGVLVVEKENEKARFVFRFGLLVFGSVLGISSQLDKILLRKGIVTEEELELVSERHRSTGAPLGQLAEDLGITSKNKIRYCMQLEAEERLFDVLLWNRGLWKFDSRESSTSETSKPTSKILTKNQARLNDIIELSSIFKHMDYKIRLKEHYEETDFVVNLTGMEMKILSLVNSPIFLEKLIEESPADKLETIRILKDLVNNNIIEMESVKPESRTFPADQVRQYASLLQYYFGIYDVIFQRMKKSNKDNARRLLTDCFMKVKQKHSLYDQVMLEAEGHFNTNKVIGNVARMNVENREYQTKNALNDYLIAQLIILKKNLASIEYDEIIKECRELLQSMVPENVVILENILQEFDSVVELVKNTPIFYKRSLKNIVTGNIYKALEKFQDTPSGGLENETTPIISSPIIIGLVFVNVVMWLFFIISPLLCILYSNRIIDWIERTESGLGLIEIIFLIEIFYSVLLGVLSLFNLLAIKLRNRSFGTRAETFIRMLIPYEFGLGAGVVVLLALISLIELVF